MWDLRIPSGFFFLLLGVILCATAVFRPGVRAPLTEADVNLYSGVAMVLFGGALLWLARRRS
jgi:hypothetical protein